MILSPAARERYAAAHRRNQDQQYPATVADFGYLKPNYPDVRKANGLTRFILMYLTWMGHRATRITSAGRMIGPAGKQRYIPGTTRKGAADISATINGRSVMFEVKVGSDRPSEHQLREQALEEKAGGRYFFTHDPEEFFAQYDSLFVSSDQQTTPLSQ